MTHFVRHAGAERRESVQIYTSNFASLRRLVRERPDLRPVSIALRPPRWYSGQSYSPLSPTEEMLRLKDPAAYDPAYRALLAALDPHRVMTDLGDGAVLLCWEARGGHCHRRLVAEWLEPALGAPIPELFT